ncbi:MULTISPECIES: alpha/beta fold hydrolase [unclassified Rathayibacter]|uniref:alpha/beta fold hydrolase n=1 Tax=unclassified Rathayibacter TaxID=2609250 RepID=UPI00188DB1BD|nr:MULTISPECIES: alpha/beta fold hydrolase [unclassified Rathayibacter]MBF4461775.1 alpha/beta fold hydrolase [Rathayibacter sp. VKM Ac-2879]MBF4503187.1 alpha/beta fold hydrolase [Rathayibacter sp. VKM Ac-2878]
MNRREEFLRRQAGLVRESQIRVAGSRVRLFTAGEASGSVVMLVTAPGRGAAEDGALLLPLLARRHRVAALELADLARPWPDGADAVAAALDALDAQEATVIGHALGASVAVAAAADPRVRALALIAGWLRPTARLLAVARLWERLADEPVARAELARLLTARSPDTLDAAPWNASASALLAAATRADVTAEAAAVRIPALVVGCAADAVVGVEGSEALLGAIDDARYALLDSGHSVLAERPAELLALLERFLADPHRDPAGSLLPRMAI